MKAHTFSIMKSLSLPFPSAATWATLGFFLPLSGLHSQTADQVVSLSTGWNSVWLEVEPVYNEGDTVTNDPANPGDDEVLAADDDRIGLMKAPQDIFTNPEISTIATPKPLAGLADFFGAEPGTIGSFNQDEWEQWKRTDPSGSNNLTKIFGNRPYLIQVTAPAAIAITGKARFFRPEWSPDRYNLIGFGLDETPTFADFFGPSGNRHTVDKIFRLNPTSGSWQRVSGGETMVSNQAYWVFASGPSDYMGPVAVDFDYAITGKLHFGGPGDSVPVGSGVDELSLDLAELVFTNLGSSAFTPELDLITADSGAGSLALQVVRPAADALAYESGNEVDSNPGAGSSSSLDETIGAQSSATLTLGAQRLWQTGLAGRTNLYRLKTGVGSASFWLPISALSNDSQLPTDLVPTGTASTAGLWVGEVNIDAVTSIVTDGAPTQPSAGSAPIRIILHSDASGAVSLLSQVTIMQTKTADPEVDPEPVLVVDPAKIPFFEGIKERNGKLVGMRLEAVAYDMPRKIDAQSQSALLADTNFPGLTEEDLADFLISRSVRPSTLTEVYHHSVSMSGAVDLGSTVQGSFSLDPFHRSNPFRHAFHRDHSNGPNVTRTMNIVFDSGDVSSDRLSATYSETIQGLINTTLELTGRVDFRRVSSVNSFQ